MVAASAARGTDSERLGRCVLLHLLVVLRVAATALFGADGANGA